MKKESESPLLLKYDTEVHTESTSLSSDLKNIRLLTRYLTVKKTMAIKGKIFAKQKCCVEQSKEKKITFFQVISFQKICSERSSMCQTL